jgi:hypothetical protein
MMNRFGIHIGPSVLQTLPEATRNHLGSMVETYEAHDDGFQQQASDIRARLKGEYQLPALGELRAKTLASADKATTFSKNIIAGELKRAEGSLPPESLPPLKTGDIAGLMVAREVRDIVRAMEPMNRGLFLQAAAKAGNTAILSAIVNDPCFLPTFSELIPAKQIEQAIKDWRVATAPESFAGFEAAQRAQQIATALTSAFTRRIRTGGTGPVAGA